MSMGTEIRDVPAVDAAFPGIVEAEIVKFAAGLEGKHPDASVVTAARRISRVAIFHTREPEIAVDVDGALSFDLRLRDGRLVLAEIGMSGRIDVSVYGVDDELQEHNPEATPDELIAAIGR